MFENASSTSQLVVLDALEWCVRLSDQSVTEKHFLLALLVNKTVLSELMHQTINVEKLIANLSENIDKERFEKAPIRFSREAQTCLNDAQKIREDMQHKFLFADHLSLAILRKGDCSLLVEFPSNLERLCRLILINFEKSLVARNYERSPGRDSNSISETVKTLHSRDPETAETLVKFLRIADKR